MTHGRAAKSSRTHVGLEQRFVASLRKLDLRPNQQIVTAFSGGKDSLALAQLFARTKTVTGVESRLLHVDHHLRPTSVQDAVQARKLAKQIGLPIVVAELRSGLTDRHPGLGIEEAARRERYVALAEFARRRRTDIIAIAHQQQDQAETVLLHLLRGAGLSGMQAMTTLVDVQIPWWEGPSPLEPFRLWRPLLDEDPEELRRYLAMYELTPIEDSTNAEPSFLRNRFRHEVLPALDAIQPRASEVIARFAKIAALEDQFLESITDAAIEELLYDDVRIDRRVAQRTQPVFLRRVLRRAMEVAGVHEIKFDRIDETSKLAFEEPSDKVIQLGDGVIAVSDVAWIYLGTEEKVTAQLQNAYDIWLFPPNWERKQSLEIKIGEPLSVEGVTIHASEDAANFGKHRPWRRFVPREAFDDRMLLRRIEDGDYWARGGGTIRELLRINGIPPVARSRLMVFASDQGVWFVPGIASPVTAHPDLKKPIVYIDIRNE